MSNPDIVFNWIDVISSGMIMLALGIALLGLAIGGVIIGFYYLREHIRENFSSNKNVGNRKP